MTVGVDVKADFNLGPYARSCSGGSGFTTLSCGRARFIEAP